MNSPDYFAHENGPKKSQKFLWNWKSDDDASPKNGGASPKIWKANPDHPGHQTNLQWN